MKSISNKKFEKSPRDLYQTWQKRPNQAVANVLPDVGTWIEPCAGEGDIIKWMQILKPNMKCVGAWDIEPLDKKLVKKSDFMDVDLSKESKFDYVITNPPFSADMRTVCHAILDKSIENARVGTWMLLPANWICNDCFIGYMEHCQKIVPIGRIKWKKGSSASESKDCLWYYFTKEKTSTYEGLLLNKNLLAKNDKNILKGI